eukprot:2590949-Prymnesium_polylepis.1
MPVLVPTLLPVPPVPVPTLLPVPPVVVWAVHAGGTAGAAGASIRTARVREMGMAIFRPLYMAKMRVRCACAKVRGEQWWLMYSEIHSEIH